MNKLLQIALASVALSIGFNAHAGALGLTTTGGLHQELSYYYSQDGQQGTDNQLLPNYGVGLEAMVGDKDEKVQGILRMNWLFDYPPVLPDTGDLEIEDALFPPAHKEDPRSVGTLGLGVQWGVLGDPTGTQLNVSAVVGTGFITTDNTEFLMIEAGVGATHNLTSSLQANVNVMGTMRYRKRPSYGPNVYAGIRYLFD
jgi:hypothetical protein